MVEIIWIWLNDVLYIYWEVAVKDIGSKCQVRDAMEHDISTFMHNLKRIFWQPLQITSVIIEPLKHEMKTVLPGYKNIVVSIYCGKTIADYKRNYRKTFYRNLNLNLKWRITRTFRYHNGSEIRKGLYKTMF